MNNRFGRGVASCLGTYAWQLATARPAKRLIYDLTNDAWTTMTPAAMPVGEWSHAAMIDQ
jgi:hypothetical protein